MASHKMLIGFAVLALGVGVLAPVANAAPSCGRKACSDEVAASGLSGNARAPCLKQVIADCNAGACSCTGGSPPCSCVCGDNLCGPSEDCSTCPRDCGACCGNGVCEPSRGEDCGTCPQDCGACCSNGVCEPSRGEDCTTCPQDCGTCAPCCDKTRLAITTAPASGRCGTVSGQFPPPLLDLACGALYLGGGASTAPGPMTLADAATLLTDVSACDPDTGALTLARRTAAETGSNRNCSAAGCLYGPPQPITDAANPAASVCVVTSLDADVRGFADCATGVVGIELFLRSEVFRNGDAVPAVAGTQPCPVCIAGGSCASGTCCAGGPNDGADCVPDDTNLGTAGPTSHDCPPDPAAHVGTIFDRTFGGSDLVNQDVSADSTPSSPTHAQSSVFCGFCRGVNGFGVCSGGPAPGSSCASHADCAPGGECQSAVPCTPFSNDLICSTSGRGNTCEQRSSGAFGEAGAAHINLVGSAAGAPGDGAPHTATFVRFACLSPSFDATVDTAFDLPGPVARSVAATVQLLP